MVRLRRDILLTWFLRSPTIGLLIAGRSRMVRGERTWRPHPARLCLARVFGSATRSLSLKSRNFGEVSRFSSLFARRWLTSIPLEKSSETGAGEGNRTPDPLFTKQLLYHLSYTGVCGLERRAKSIGQHLYALSSMPFALRLTIYLLKCLRQIFQKIARLKRDLALFFCCDVACKAVNINA